MIIKTEYTCGDIEYKASGAETKHFSIIKKEKDNCLTLKILPNRDIKFKKFQLIFNYEYDDNCRIFVNGYQSWTDSREYFKTEYMSHLHPLSKKRIMKHPMHNAGDYSFKKYPSRGGIFYGWSYGYVRLDDHVELFGSVTEKCGFTSITFDTVNKKVVIEKDLEGVTVNEGYKVIQLFRMKGTMDEVFDGYFDAMNIPKPRVSQKCGYTTWYNYYPDINEQIVTDDLEALAATGEKIDIFQIDDGYQTAVGDWLSVDEKKLPNGMKAIADKIHSKNMLAGLWLAPLGCQIDSVVAKEHPDWLIKDSDGNPVNCGDNWGGFYALDISVPEAATYIKNFFDVILNQWGYDMVKLDFLYAACVVPNKGKSRGQLMCEAMNFIRECVGDKLILGCGVPLAPAFGKVDFCRIGADVDLSWKTNLYEKMKHREDVSTKNTINCTIFRRELNGRAFLNDPDVFLLRDYNISMKEEQRKLVAKINKLFGGLLFISDNTDKYSAEQLENFRETIAKDDIKILKAEYVLPKIMEIKYSLNGEEHLFRFNSDNGKILSGKI